MPSGCALILTSFISTTTSDSAGTEPRITTHVGGQSRRQTRSPGLAAPALEFGFRLLLRLDIGICRQKRQRCSPLSGFQSEANGFAVNR
jgi:hypothetical protein